MRVCGVGEGGGQTNYLSSKWLARNIAGWAGTESLYSGKSGISTGYGGKTLGSDFAICET